MRYPIHNQCPTTHPVVVPQVFIEIVWDTAKFTPLWEPGTPNPFVWSMGDPYVTNFTLAPHTVILTRDDRP